MQTADRYPPDHLQALGACVDVIAPMQADTLDGLLRARIAKSPDKIAYRQHDGRRWHGYSWKTIGQRVEQWRSALAHQGLVNQNAAHGARVAIRMRNCIDWVLCEQSCLANGLVVVPLYAQDRADNVAYILAHTEAEVLVLENVSMLREMAGHLQQLTKLKRVVVCQGDDDGDDSVDSDRRSYSGNSNSDIDSHDSRVVTLSDWLDEGQSFTSAPSTSQASDLATIVYTSGTTGKPKGVMLSHANILRTAHAGVKSAPVLPSDLFLSFLPLSHMFERTVGYYTPMMCNAVVAFNRSIEQLPDDLAAMRPTVLVSVPRIFERAYNAIGAQLEGAALRRWLFKCAVSIGYRRFEIRQGRGAWRISQLLHHPLDALVGRKVRARFGGRLRMVISGGAPLAENISRTFIALGVDILQGYGLTETSPTLSVNTLDSNQPSSVGLPLSEVQLRIDDAGELHAKGDGVMGGYWRDEKSTREVVDAHGWFATGDLARIDADGFVYINGRRKEIIVLATGEKAPPADMESAICDDALFEQAMVVGERRAFLAAVVVVNADSWRRTAAQLGLDANDDDSLNAPPANELMRKKIAAQLRDFPGYAVVHQVWASRAIWGIEDGAITPTLKLKRAVLRERFAERIEWMYRER